MDGGASGTVDSAVIASGPATTATGASPAPHTGEQTPTNTTGGALATTGEVRGTGTAGGPWRPSDPIDAGAPVCTSALEETLVSDMPSSLGCPEPPVCEKDSTETLPLLFDAEDLGAGVHLIDLDGHYVLAQHPAEEGGAHFMARTTGPDDVERFELPPLAGFDELVLEAVAAPYSEAQVIRCDATHCAVDSMESDDALPKRLTEFELATLGEESLEGFLATPSQGCRLATDFCVFGSGLHCYGAGAWTTEIAAEDGQRLHAAAPVRGCLPDMVVGKGGLVLRHDSTQWQRIDSGTTDDFVAVGENGDGAHRFTAATATGLTLEGNDFGTVLCELGLAAPVMLTRRDDAYNCRLPGGAGVDRQAAARGLDTHALGLGPAGHLVGTDNSCDRECERWYCGARVEGALDWTLAPCGAATNPRVLTADGVYGTHHCITVP